jgi:hypothetical protein
MGLTNWDGARIRKGDVSVAKNYLSEVELRALNNLAEQYLIFAEGQAERRVAMTMQDWIIKLEGFLTLNDREILRDAGKVSAEIAKAHAEGEFARFRMIDDKKYESDFDRLVKLVPGKNDLLDDCHTKNRVVAEYALRDSNKPIGVAEYQLLAALPEDLQTSLPSTEQIERELEGDV